MSDSDGPVRLLRPTALAAQVPYAYAAVTQHPARLVVTAGACPLDAAGRVVAPGDVAAQARQCADNLFLALAEAGAGAADVLFLRVLVATSSREDLGDAWGVVAEAFGEHDPPGTLQGVTVLGWPDQLVEVEAVAALADERPGPRNGVT